jgi:hypothetical protein
MTKREAFDRMRRVRDELAAARFSLSYTLRVVNENLSALQAAGKDGTSPSELARCRENLEINYILRIFSEFEGAVRSYWVSQVRNTRPNISTLMDRVADRLDITAPVLVAAHEIRNFRNDVVHQNPRALTFDYSDCAKSLGNYLGFLPQNW